MPYFDIDIDDVEGLEARLDQQDKAIAAIKKLILLEKVQGVNLSREIKVLHILAGFIDGQARSQNSILIKAGYCYANNGFMAFKINFPELEDIEDGFYSASEIATIKELNDFKSLRPLDSDAEYPDIDGILAKGEEAAGACPASLQINLNPSCLMLLSEMHQAIKGDRSGRGVKFTFAGKEKAVLFTFDNEPYDEDISVEGLFMPIQIRE